MKPREISVYTHGLSDMAPWAGLARCGSPLRGEDRSSVHVQENIQRVRTWSRQPLEVTGMRAPTGLCELIACSARTACREGGGVRPHDRFQAFALHAQVVGWSHTNLADRSVHRSHCLKSVQFAFSFSPCNSLSSVETFAVAAGFWRSPGGIPSVWFRFAG